MSILPILTFKAGICDLDTSTSPPKVRPKTQPGYIYLYAEDELVHFCWRPRSAPLDHPELDLVMVPTDGHFQPYDYEDQPATSSQIRTPTNGRIYVLKFSSSSQRHLFWLQSKSQHPSGNPGWFSPRDLKLGQIIDQLLQGEEVDVHDEIANIQNDNDDEPDGDETMEDIEGTGEHGGDHHGSSGGGAGPDATGGDIREEGEPSREGGADGGRALSSTDPSTIVQNFLNSLKGAPSMGPASQAEGKLFTTLGDLLPAETTAPVIEAAGQSTVDHLLSFLPPDLMLLAQEVDDISSVDPNSETARAAIQALSVNQKKDILRRVVRSPQFSQSLASLTAALRDGGLPGISDALRIKVENGGLVRGGGVPLGSGEAVEAFLQGVRRSVEEENGNQSNRMETD
ncbi:hypothetical protein L228DRAFT_242797 [Xylona heveae TC161]|uniref:Pru domain-containing protein n=1 Tax=Xylona heveae (strain CBS 132557 / TC161) TaxID=1328760 RepID=A0A165JK85_XYLHT|nr:hypothetical protein L228DRAFT_242797 [Xylona heveae TC161]KZF26337.1 hypothetical protein L228DRAFT_242797 [Xylona heveae TC161]